MKIIIFTILILSSLHSPAQKKNDTRIIVTMPDTTDLYKKTKIAIANSNFIVIDNYNTDTLGTYVKELDFFRGHMAVLAIISGNTVTFTGIYGLNQAGFWDFSELPDRYQRVNYYNGSKTWRVLRDVAIKMQGQMTFSK